MTRGAATTYDRAVRPAPVLAIAGLVAGSSTIHADDYDDPETEAALREVERVLAGKSRETVAPAPDADPQVQAPPIAPRARPRAPGVALGRGRIVATLTIEANLSSGKVLAPVSIAPDVSYGLTDRWTVSVVHSGFATTGFRGSAGSGLCLTGEADGCEHVYDNAGAEALVDLVRGDLAVAAVGGVHAVSLERTLFDLKVGAQAIYRTGLITATFAPSALIGITRRDANNEGTALLPVSVGAQLGGRLFIAAGGGVAAPLADLGGGWTARLGVITRYRVARGTFVAMSLFLPRLAGGDEVASTGVDARTANLWLTYAR